METDVIFYDVKYKNQLFIWAVFMTNYGVLATREQFENVRTATYVTDPVGNVSTFGYIVGSTADIDIIRKLELNQVKLLLETMRNSYEKEQNEFRSNDSIKKQNGAMN